MYENCDRGLYSQDEGLRSPTNDQQDTYWYLRAQLTQALARDWQRVLDASPATLQAQAHLDSFLERHRTSSFRVFRSEDIELSVDARSRLFVR